MIETRLVNTAIEDQKIRQNLLDMTPNTNKGTRSPLEGYKPDGFSMQEFLNSKSPNNA
jgi:hypothetical protein